MYTQWVAASQHVCVCVCELEREKGGRERLNCSGAETMGGQLYVWAWTIPVAKVKLD